MDVEIWDVFADRPLAGNALAVVHVGGRVADAAMQRLAREFGFSETVFVRTGPARAQEPGRPELRIFTPERELPMAGHPTIGAAFSLDRLGTIDGPRATFTSGIGPVDLTLERDEHGGLQRAWMDQGRPRRETVVSDRPAVAAALGLEPHELRAGLPIEAWSAGNPFLLVPLADLEALGRARLELSALGPWIDADHRAVLAFVPSDSGPQRCRMFGEALGVVEDPGTGSAHGPLAAYLVRHGLVPFPADGDGDELESVQGVEMGRPSRLFMRIRPPDTARTDRAPDATAPDATAPDATAPELADVRVEVGGRAFLVLEGRLKASLEEASLEQAPLEDASVDEDAS
ncbi:MAG: PhzF family phenazine biosynthesis protein [Trueperaceae bacterium]|nr:PhzF family phenazine biosynthesis protein [Trueperaceae bacterium]